MAWSAKIFRSRFGIYKLSNRFSAVMCGNTSRHAVERINAHREWRTVKRCVGVDHHVQVEFFEAVGGCGQTDQSASMARHKIDGFRCHLFRRHDEIAFVFPVFIIDHNDDFSHSNIFECVFYCCNFGHICLSVN